MRAAGSVLTVGETRQAAHGHHHLERVYVQVGEHDGTLLPVVEAGALGDSGGQLVLRVLDARALDPAARDDLAESLTWMVEEADSLSQVQTEARRLLKALRLQGAGA